MVFSLKNGSNYYEFPINPQTFTFNPSPKIAIQKTIGGTVIQFLGATSQIQATGLINTQNSLNFNGRYAEGGILAQFIKECHLNQKTGQTTLLTYDEEGIEDLPVTVNDFNFKFDTETVALTYSLDFFVNQMAEIKKLGSMDDWFKDLVKEIGFKDTGKGWHGGNGESTTTSLKYKAITGFSGMASNQNTNQPTSANVTGSATMTPKQAQAYAYSQLTKYGLDPSQFQDLVNLWNKESSWNMHAENASSGAYGIPQADPDGGQGIANASNYRNNAMVQIQWGLKYIKERYGSLANAWAHEVADNWY